MSNIDDDPGAPSDRVRSDATPPRNQTIAVYSLLAVGALFGVKFAADAYLEANTRAVRSGHLEESIALEELEAYRSEGRAALEGGVMPIDEAVDALAERNRAVLVQIRPTRDTSDAARIGWATLPAAAPEAAPHATRTVFTLSEEEMPPADAELEAYEAAIEAGTPPPPAPRAPRPAAPPPG